MREHRITVFFLLVLVAGFAWMTTSRAAQNDRQAEKLLQSALNKEFVDGDIEAAIKQYKDIVTSHSGNRPVAAKALVQLGQAYEKTGNAQAQKAYEQILREYGDQREALDEARRRLTALGVKPLGSSAGSYGGTQILRKIWQDAAGSLGKASSDGRYVPFVDGRDLSVRDLMMGVNRRLTDARPCEGAAASAISQDGKQVAYSWYRCDGEYDLRITGVDNKDSRVILINPEISYLEPQEWTADKKILTLMRKKDGGVQIALIHPDGSTQVLKTLAWQWPGVSLSPDGRFIAYDVPQGESSLDRDIFVLTAEGSREDVLIRSPGDDYVLGWTADAKRFLFASDRSGNNGIWGIGTSDGKPTGSPQLVKADIGEVRSLGITRAGSLIYRVTSTMRDVYIASLDDSGRIAGAPVRTADRLVGSISGPDWSPDGKSLVLVKWRRNRPDSLLLHSLEGKKDQELSSESVTNFALPRWSPKGDAILVLASRIDNNDRVLAVFNVSTAEMKVVAQNSPMNGGLGVPEWSVDGSAVIYRMGRLSVIQVLATGAQKTIASSTWTHGTGDLSRDGRMLIVPITNARGLDIVDIEHAEQHELVHFKQTQGIGNWTWSPDGKSVFVVMIHDNRVRSIDQTSELYRVPVDGGEPKSLGRFNGVAQWPRIDPAGRRIAYSVNQPGPTEVWALENLVP